ncbi:hypothetical protein ES707_06689 [subsurface metagenome]
MTDYKSMYNCAKKDGTAKQRTAKYKEWDQKGQVIVGKYISANPVQSKMSDGSYNQYLFETDEGLIKFALGKSTDQEVSEILVKFNVYAIEFLGQEDLTGGRRVNKFNVLELAPSGEPGAEQPVKPEGGTAVDKK